MHIGSQIFALHSFGEAIEVIVEFAARIKETYGYEIDEIDVGGGLGIAYTQRISQLLSMILPKLLRVK